MSDPAIPLNEDTDTIAVPEYGITQEEQDGLYVGEDEPETTDEEASEADPAQETPAAKEPPPGIEIEGLGRLTPEQIRHMAVAQTQYQQYLSQKQQFDKERQDFASQKEELSEAIQVANLLKYDTIRQRLMDSVADLVKNPEGVGDANRDGNAKQFLSQFQNPQLEELKSKVEEADRYIASVREREAAAEADRIFGEFQEKFPDVVNDAFKDAVIDKAGEAWAGREDQFQPNDLRALISWMILEKGIPAAKAQGAAELAEALAKQPHGTRVVTGNSTRKAAVEKEKDATKMSYGELQSEIASKLFEEP
jgi:hypothetical protein